MNVLMTADAVGGVWTYAMDLSAWLMRRGAHVTVATIGPLPSLGQLTIAKRLGVSVVSNDAKLEWMEDPWDDVRRAGDWLVDLERALRPDIVHVNGYAHSACDFHAPVVAVAHSCVLSWWRAVWREPAPARYERYHTEVKRGLSCARAVVVPTRAMASELRAHYGFVGPTTIIPNGTSLAECASKDELVVRRRFVLAAGRVWDEAKNVAALARVARGLSWPVFVAGEAQRPGGRAGFDAPTLHLLGQLDRPALARFMMQASIFALPARYEPFGLTAVEAALAGCALVLGDIPSLREVWGDAAQFVAPDDDAALLATTRALIRDGDLLRDMAMRAKCRARRYTVERMGEAYRAVYQSASAPASAAVNVHA